MYNLSACTFIRNASQGYCLWESMASWLPLVDEFVVLDLGSTDGTVALLDAIANTNPKVKLYHGEFPVQDARAFADVMNTAISYCTHPHIIAYQADEIPHQHVLELAKAEFAKGNFDLSFWRYQLKENFQVMKWPPHPVHRVGTLEAGFTFVDDGMNTKRTWDARLCCGDYDGGWFIRWGREYEGRYPELPTHEMILDVGKSGAFRDIIVARAQAHFPFWHDGQPNVDGVPCPRWEQEQKANTNWTQRETPFDIPHIMRFHLGETRYFLRRQLFEALKHDTTRDLLCP